MINSIRMGRGLELDMRIQNGWDRQSAAFSSDTWSRNHKREYDATPKRYGEVRGAVEVINTIGTTFGDAVMATTGMFLFSITNGISGIDAGLRNNRMNIKPKRMKIK